MACGHVTTALEGEAAVDLAPPVVSRLSGADWEAMAAASHSVAFVSRGPPRPAVARRAQ